MTAATVLAGAARLPLAPPLGLPMLGFIRQPTGARGYGELPLETTALVLRAEDGTTLVLCGLDVAYVPTAEATALTRRIAEAVGADPAGVLLNFNHTHLAPHGGMEPLDVLGPLDDAAQAAVARAAATIQEQVLSVCVVAAAALEPARIVWGVGAAPVAANRRERLADGRTILGWNPDNLLDDQVTTLQARRPDESVIATAVAFGCHPVTTGFDMDVYSADFPGAMRDLVRQATGGECVFLQAAGGNVLPRVAFTTDEREAVRVGRRLALEGLRSVADRRAFPVRAQRYDEGSVTPIAKYRAEPVDAPAPVLAAVSETVRFPLLPHPAVAEVDAWLAEFEAAYARAVEAGDRGQVKVAWYGVGWARRVRAMLLDGSAPTDVPAPVHALRIGDGAIVTGPGEVFTEIGMAAKERGPGRPTVYLGYTNGLVSYFPTAAEYAHGGYEAATSHRGVKLPSLVAPDCARLLVERAVRLAEGLFPGARPWPDGEGWTATGALRSLPDEELVHPERTSGR